MKPILNKFEVVVERNTDPAYYPFTVRAMGLEYSGKTLKSLLRKLANEIADKLAPSEVV
jgi:hypothetical protein